MPALADLVVNLTAETAAFSRKLDEAHRDVTKFVGNVESSFRSLRNIGATLAGAFAVRELEQMVRQTAAHAEQMANLSQSYGLSVQTISSFRAAAKLTGVDLETITAGMSRLARSAGEVAKTGDLTGGAFRAIGVNVASSAGQLRPMNDLLGDVAEKFSKLQDGTGKTALAIQLFGRSGASLIPFLNEGRDGIEKLIKVSEDLGLAWTEKDIKAAKELDDQFDVLNLKVTTLKEKFVLGALPALNDFASILLKTDSAGNSLVKTLGEDFGSVMVKLAQWTITAAAGFREMFLGIQFGMQLVQQQQKQIAEAPFWEKLTGIAAFKALAVTPSAAMQETVAQLDKVQKEWEERMTRIQAGFKLPSFGKAGAGKIPNLAEPADIAKVSAELDKLIDKTRQLLDRTEGDKLQLQFDKLAASLKELEAFRDAHPQITVKGKQVQIIWADINQTINEVNAALRQTAAQQKLVRDQMEAGFLPMLQENAKAIEDVLQGAKDNAPPVPSFGLPDTKAIVDGVVRMGETAKIAEDAFRRAITPLQQYEIEVGKLNAALEAGAITPELYAASIQKLNEEVLRGIDPMATFRQGLERIAALKAAGAPDWIVGGELLENIRRAADLWDQALLKTQKFSAGVAVAFHQFALSAKDEAQMAFQAFSRLFEDINHGLASLITGMEFDWKRMIQSFNTQLVEGILKAKITGPLFEKLGAILFPGENNPFVALGSAASNPMYVRVVNPQELPQPSQGAIDITGNLPGIHIPGIPEFPLPPIFQGPSGQLPIGVLPGLPENPSLINDILGISDSAQSAWGQAANTTEGAFVDAGEKVSNSWLLGGQKVFDGLGTGLAGILSGIAGMFGGGGGIFGGLLSAVVGGIFGAFGGGIPKVPSYNSPLMSGLHGFASGGFLEPGTWGIAGEAGAELIYGGKAGMTVFPSRESGGTQQIFNIDARGAAPGEGDKFLRAAREIAKVVSEATVAKYHQRRLRGGLN